MIPVGAIVCSLGIARLDVVPVRSHGDPGYGRIREQALKEILEKDMQILGRGFETASVTRLRIALIAVSISTLT